jgi:trigger factor
MQVVETASEGLKREFTIRIPAHDIESKLTNRLQELSTKIQKPGFRPGKVPMPLLKKQYGPSLMGEILEQAVADGTRQALTDKGYRPAMQPKIEIKSFEEGGDLEYALAVELMPEIKQPTFGDIAVEKMTVAIDETQVDETVKRLADEQRVYDKAPDGAVATEKDALLVDFTGRVGGEAFEGGTAKDFQIELDSTSFIPGFIEQLRGAKAGDKLTVKVKFPDEYGNKSLAGKDAEFEVDVKEVRNRAAISVDDELAKRMGLENLEAMRKAIRERMEQEYASVTRMRVKRNLLDELAKRCDFELPNGMVEGEFDAIWKQVSGQGQQEHDHDHDHDHDHHDHAGHDHAAGEACNDPSHDHGGHEGHDHGAEEKLGGELAGKSPEEIEKLRGEYREIAARRVKLGLLLSEVGRLNNIDVSQDDLNRAILNEARRFPGQERAVYDYYQKNEQALQQLRAPLYEDKVVDYILELAKVNERKVSAEELLRDPEEDEAAGESDEKPKKNKKK